jgi:hypothetical protein
MGAYMKALKNGWLNDYTWFEDKKGKEEISRIVCGTGDNSLDNPTSLDLVEVPTQVLVTFHELLVSLLSILYDGLAE